MVQEKTLKNIKDYGTLAIIILSILLLGMLAANQTINYFYKNQLLQNPCNLCQENNPGYCNPETDINIVSDPQYIAIFNVT